MMMIIPFTSMNILSNNVVYGQEYDGLYITHITNILPKIINTNVKKAHLKAFL